MEEKQESSHRRDTEDTARLRIQYLTFYNIFFAALWFTVGITSLILYFLGSSKLELFAEIEPLARWLQTLTCIEVVHAATGM